MKNIGPFTYRGARFSYLIVQLCVTFAQFQRYLHLSALLDIQGVTRVNILCALLHQTLVRYALWCQRLTKKCVTQVHMHF
jgi:hypothetical protein